MKKDRDGDEEKEEDEDEEEEKEEEEEVEQDVGGQEEEGRRGGEEGGGGGVRRAVKYHTTKIQLTGYQGCDYIKQLRVVPQQQSVHNTFQHVHLH